MMYTVTSDPAPVPPTADGVLRPSRAAYKRAMRANLYLAIPLLIVSLVRVGLNPWLLPVLVGAALLSVGGVMLYFRNARVEFGGGRYRIHSIFGGVKEFGAADVARLVTVTALVAGTSVATTPQLLLTRADGTKLLRLRGQTWDVEQFTELANDLVAHGVTMDAIPEPITPAQLRLRYPRAIGVTEAHPIAFGLILGLAITVIVIVVVVLIAFALAAAG
jgi:hypothetical protein